MPISKQQLLDVIREDIIAHNVCPALRETARNLVMGDGNADADIVFIGEAPGKREDQQGLPFVGASGKFLDEMLASVGLKRSDVYITNIVKYRPPGNRDPSPAEKQTFLPYLLRQLDVINPKLVVTLGRHSMEYFLPEHKISAIHGQVKYVSVVFPKIGKKTVVILPLYHPAAALYNGSQRSVLMDDFSKVPAILRQLYSNNYI